MPKCKSIYRLVLALRRDLREVKVQKQNIYFLNIDTCFMYNQCIDRYVRTNVFRL